MSLLDQITGRTSVSEMTTTGAMGTTVMGSPTLASGIPGAAVTKKKKLKRKTPVSECVPIPATVAAHQKKKNSDRTNGRKQEESIMDRIIGRRRLRETEDDDPNELDAKEIIPKDAEDVVGTGVDRPELMNDTEDDVDNVQEPLMSPSVALVAPDVTPGAFQPLSVDRVEKSHNIPPKPAPPAQAAPPPDDEVAKSQALMTLMGQMGAPTAESAPAPEVSIPSVSRAGMSGDDLLGQGGAMPHPVAPQPSKIWETFGRLHNPTRQ